MPESIEDRYIHSILGLRNPLPISEEDAATQSSSGFVQLLRVDSLFNLGKTQEAKAALSQISLEDAYHDSFRDGLESLLEGDLTKAYDCFVQASKQAEGLVAVFYGERAVNIAFWVACSGKMWTASQHLPVRTQPFAAGVQSFAHYMNGSVHSAEIIARQAIQDGFRDPWTLHSVAHCLYSQGKAKECSEFLDQHRSLVQRANPSAFMKGHMEFHQALCCIDLQDVTALHRLIDGPLWKDLTDAEQKDYWNASGILNALWKAELRGLPQCVHQEALDQAMKILMPTASATKSSVFSLCILRWATGEFRVLWRDRLLQQSDNPVLQDLARAVDLVYPTTTEESPPSSFSSQACAEATEKYLAKNVDQLDQLGASPEQREVIEEFVVVAAKAAGNGALPITTIHTKGWTERNYRPNTPFYESFLGLKGD